MLEPSGIRLFGTTCAPGKRSFPPSPNQTTVNYAIGGWSEDGEEIFADYPDAEERLRHATMRCFKSLPEDSVYAPEEQGPAPIFTYHVDRISPPKWAQEAIIYQIFLDRFTRVMAGTGCRPPI